MTDIKKTFLLSNGLQVICEPLDVEYVASQLIIPGGIVNDSPEQDGLSLVLAEVTSRGASSMDARELAQAYDEDGIRHSESASLYHFGYRSSFLPEKLESALKLMKMLVSEPNFPEDAVEPVKSIFLQDIMSLRENPARWAISELRNRYFPKPYNRSGNGTLEGVESLSISNLKEAWQERFGPQGSVLSIAGKVNGDDIQSTIESIFGNWSGKTRSLPEFGAFPSREELYIQAPGSQQQLVLSYNSAPFDSSDYYTAKVFSQILSGGMFGRLFLEVREKRGLCYSVFAQHSARKEYGAIIIYAGTTPERVHETLSVIEEVMNDPLVDLTDEELDRAKANLISQIVLSEESTSSHASSNVSDWLLLGRIRTLAEIKKGIMDVTEETLLQFIKKYPFQDVAKLTLGEKNFSDWKSVVDE